MNDRVRVRVVGLGYWRPNLAHNFERVPGCDLRWLCDASDNARDRWIQDVVFAFLACILEHRTPRSGPEAGLRVVRVLEALQASLDRAAVALCLA